MRTSILSGTMLALLLAVGSTPARAQVCLDFTSFCDGLELVVSGNDVSGFWVNTDCAGTDVPIIGRKGSLANACGAPTNAVGCHPNNYPGGCVAGANWWFSIDTPVDSTMDMSQGNYPSGSCWISPLSYNLTFGPCGFANNAGEREQSATTQ